ncbi:hypothetical protein ABZV23_33435 [Streptomyces hirsutus]
MPYVQDPHDRGTWGGLLEREVDGGGVRAAVDPDHEVRRLLGEVLRFR